MNLDDLEYEVRKLLTLLENRQGTATWHGFVQYRLLQIKELIRRAGV